MHRHPAEIFVRWVIGKNLPHSRNYPLGVGFLGADGLVLLLWILVVLLHDGLPGINDSFGGFSLLLLTTTEEYRLLFTLIVQVVESNDCAALNLNGSYLLKVNRVGVFPTSKTNLVKPLNTVGVDVNTGVGSVFNLHPRFIPRHKKQFVLQPPIKKLIRRRKIIRYRHDGR